LIPPYIDIPLILAESLTGSTAYFGLKEIGKPKSGETVLISGAAGATGSIAGQIAKLKGARVIGIAGGKDKCRWLKEKAHFNETIDYKSENIEKRIGELCPKGVDVFFDNVGGEILDAALLHLAMGARIVLCGQISQYDKIDQISKGAHTYGVKGTAMLIMRRAKMQGFIVTDYKEKMTESLLCLNQWIEDGKIVQEIDLKEGFENIPETLIRIFEGKNIGKQLLKLSDPPFPLNKTYIGKTLFKAYQRFVSWRTR
jgi:NADPH-dependent curcumin reductase CurA